MKITKLEKHNGKYELTEVPEKINEIIDLLNNSFITLDPGTVHGSVTDSLTDISCDRLTPFTNETTCELTIDHLSDMVKSESIYSGIRCPKCSASYFQVGPSVSTCVYYPLIIKDGVNINADYNESVTTYTCCVCGHTWKE